MRPSSTAAHDEKRWLKEKERAVGDARMQVAPPARLLHQPYGEVTNLWMLQST